MLNAAAGGGRAGRAWNDLAARSPEIAALDVLRADSAGSTRTALRRRLDDEKEKVERVIAVGGDGTAHLVANEIVAAGRAGDVALGIAAAGTGGDFARFLDLPRSLEGALRLALDTEPRAIDLVEMVPDDPALDRRIVLNIASAGLSGQVVEEVTAARKAGKGKSGYLGATIRALWRYRPRACRVVVDGELFADGPFFLVAVANGQYFGQGMRVAPDAALDDGLLDVVHVRPVPRYKLPWLLPRFLVGRHVGHPLVTVRRAREVHVEPRREPPADSLPYELDGEIQPAVACTFRVLPGALRLCAP